MFVKRFLVLGLVLVVGAVVASMAYAEGQDGGAPEGEPMLIAWDPKNKPTCPNTNGQEFGWKFDLEDGADGNYGPVNLKVNGGTLTWAILNNGEGGYDAAYIMIKGGPSEVVKYTFDFTDATSWDDGGTLTAPINPNTNRPYGVSHVYICLDPKGRGDN